MPLNHIDEPIRALPLPESTIAWIRRVMGAQEVAPPPVTRTPPPVEPLVEPGPRPPIHEPDIRLEGRYADNEHADRARDLDDGLI